MKSTVLILVGPKKIGGLERRYIKCFNKLQADTDNIYLIVNEELKKGLTDHQIPLAEKNIFVIKQEKEFKSYKIPLSFQVYAFFKIVSFVRQKRISNVHLVQTQIMLSFLLSVLSFYKRTLTFAHTDFDYGYQKGIKKTLLKYILSHAYQTDFLSNEILKKYKSKYPDIAAKTVNYITPCSYVDYTRFFPGGNKENIIISVSRLDPIKNTHLLIEAINIIVNVDKKPLNGYTVHIIGDGPEKTRIENLIRLYNLQDYIFTGYTYDSSELLKKSKIFISIQQTNNYPSQSLLEAMACGNAIVASDVGETRLLVDESNGILVSLHVESISQALLNLINNEEEIKRMGQHSVSKVTSSHTIEIFARYLKDKLYAYV